MQIKISLIRSSVVVGRCKLELDSDSAHISNVLIYKKYRGLGYCSHLISKAVNRARSRKIKNISLHVSSKNTPAIRCYKKVGFKVVRKNYDNGKLFGFTMKFVG